MDSIVQIISTVGFPIAACIAMGWFFKYMYDKNCEVTTKMTEALNNNTLALTKLAERLDKNNE